MLFSATPLLPPTHDVFLSQSLYRCVKPIRESIAANVGRDTHLTYPQSALLQKSSKRLNLHGSRNILLALLAR